MGVKLEVHYSNRNGNLEENLLGALSSILGEPDATATGAHESVVVYKFKDRTEGNKWRDAVKYLKRDHSILTNIVLLND